MIQDLIDDLGLSDGETRRINCPHCSGFKTFTISILEGVAVWNCYKASCPSKGAAKQTQPPRDASPGLGVRHLDCKDRPRRCDEVESEDERRCCRRPQD